MAATLTDKLSLPLTLLRVLSKTIYTTITPVFTGYTSPTYLTHVTNASFRAFLSIPSPLQLQYLMPPFISTYKAHCISSNTPPNIVPIPNSQPPAQAFWIGNPAATKYHMLYFHGGGFVLPGSPGHIALMENMARWSNNNLSILAICYSLSPAVLYPTALAQCVEAVRYILSLDGASPDTLLLAGDSAGASLCLGVLAHIKHGHPRGDVVKSLTISSPLRAALLISPFISADDKRYKSITRQSERDIFTGPTARKWMGTYLGGVAPASGEEEYFVYPAHAPASWWKGTPCTQMLVTAGEDEGLLDSIVDWAGKYREGVGIDAIKFVVGAQETHISPIMHSGTEAQLVANGEKSQEGAVRLWVIEELGQT